MKSDSWTEKSSRNTTSTMTELPIITMKWWKKLTAHILNTWSGILSPIHNLIWPEAIQPIRFSKDHRCFSCRLQQREAHKDHRLATYRERVCITILSSKDWAGAQESCATASPPHRHTHTEGGFGPASRNQRSLGQHPGPDPPPTRPAENRQGSCTRGTTSVSWSPPPTPFS